MCLMPGLALGVPVVAARLPKFTPERRSGFAGGRRAQCVLPAHGAQNVEGGGSGDIWVALGGLWWRAARRGDARMGAQGLWGEHQRVLRADRVQHVCVLLWSAVCACGGATGKAVPGFDVAVIDEAGQVTDGEGDIAVKRGAASMMLEYWNKPEASAEKFRGDWL